MKAAWDQAAKQPCSSRAHAGPQRCRGASQGQRRDMVWWLSSCWCHTISEYITMVLYWCHQAVSQHRWAASLPFLALSSHSCAICKAGFRLTQRSLSIYSTSSTATSLTEPATSSVTRAALQTLGFSTRPLGGLRDFRTHPAPRDGLAAGGWHQAERLHRRDVAGGGGGPLLPRCAWEPGAVPGARLTRG